MNTSGPCAKRVVRCTIVLTDGMVVIGENWCANPQQTCPREKGEDYAKCQTICQQAGHAEEDALHKAKQLGKPLLLVGAKAYLEGHTYACRFCQEALFDAGCGLYRGAPPMYP